MAHLRRTSTRVGAALVVLAAAAGAAGGPSLAPAQAAAVQADPARCPQLQLADRWHPGNADRIQAVIDERGTCSAPGARPRPLAVFDWDNTMIKNDIADQTLFWMLRNDKLLQPPRRDWSTTSRWMTRAGARALREACGRFARPGRPLPTSRATGCTDELLAFRKEGETRGGRPAFAGYDHRTMEASYAWMAQLMQGRRPSQVRRFARRARAAALAAPQGATWRVGSGRETAWIRYYPQMRDLVATLGRAGFDAWVVSASPQEWADVWGAGIGIDADHTIGIRTVKRAGRITPHLRGCGGTRDGADRVMTYIDGKRCWINQAILGIEGAAALQLAPPERRQAIAGGDADTDVTMLRDATGVHIVLNRNKTEVMCRAFADQDGRWVVNSMFIDPLPRLAERYPCSTAGAVDASGRAVPLIGDDGAVVPDQADEVRSAP